jgi:probable phosphoglycerate mutase
MMRLIMKLILHCDGASKGNPGPAGIGVVLYRDGETEPLAAIGENIGKTTNNVAEYQALIRGLREALLKGADQIEVRTDSELMARQIQGRYKVNSPDLLPLWQEARVLMTRFERATITHVLRGKNALADKLANQGVTGGAAATVPKPSRKPAPRSKPATAPAAPPESTPEPERKDFRHTYSTTENGERLVYNVERLWELARVLPVKKVPVAAVRELDEDCWFGGKAPTLRKVGEHARRIYQADFSHPILLNASGGLMDGGHRVVKAWLDGQTEIDAVQFAEDPEPDFREPVSPPSDATT